MKPIQVLIGFILLLSVNGFGQNKTTINGLRIGPWSVPYDSINDFYGEDGSYNVVTIKSLDTIRCLGSFFEVRFKNATPLLFYNERFDDSISVKDGIWKTYISAKPEASYISFWINGIRTWQKEFDSAGTLVEHSFWDFEKGINYNLQYRDGQVFKKAYYPPDDGNHEIVKYYPNQQLFIADAEPRFYANFYSNPLVVDTIQIACKKRLKIQSITSSSGNIQISNQIPPKNLRLKGKDTLNLLLKFTPTSKALKDFDTISIKTKERGIIRDYKIYCSTEAAHLDYHNVEKTTEISLSKTKDGYLIIAPMGTQTDVCVDKPTEKICYQMMAGLTPRVVIDLHHFSAGEYLLSIVSCSVYGFIKLKVME